MSEPAVEQVSEAPEPASAGEVNKPAGQQVVVATAEDKRLWRMYYQAELRAHLASVQSAECWQEIQDLNNTIHFTEIQRREFEEKRPPFQFHPPPGFSASRIDNDNIRRLQMQHNQQFVDRLRAISRALAGLRVRLEVLQEQHAEISERSKSLNATHRTMQRALIAKGVLSGAQETQ